MGSGENDEVRFPQMRANLISAIEFLANSTVEWKHVRYDKNGTLVSFIDFHMAINILFDDIDDLDVHTREQIGYALANEAEADAMQRVVQALDIILDVDYPEDVDEDYVKTPRWLDVTAAAREALRVIKSTEPTT